MGSQHRSGSSRALHDARRVEATNPDLIGLIAGLHEAALVIGKAGNVEFANARIYDLLGWSPDDLVSKPVMSLLPERLTAELGEEIRDFFAGPVDRGPVRLPVLQKDGTELDIDVVVSSLDHAGVPTALATLRPATPAPRVERAAVAEDELLEMLDGEAPFDEAIHNVVEHLGRRFDFDIAVLWVVDDRVARMRCTAFWQRTPDTFPTFERATLSTSLSVGEGLPGRAWARHEPVVTDDSANDLRSTRATAAAVDGVHSGVAFPVADAERTVAVVELYRSSRGTPDAGLRRSLARVGHALGHFVGRGLTEEHLTAERARLELALEVGAMGVWEWDVRTGVVRWSANINAVLGTGGEFLGVVEDFANSLHPDDRADTLRAFLRSVERGSTGDLHLEYRVVALDGSVHWLETRGRAIPDASGQTMLVTGISTDITERKRAAMELERDRARLELALESGALGTWEFDLAGDELRLSPLLADLLQLPASTSFDTAAALVHPDERDQVAAEILESVQTGRRIEFTHRAVMPDGTVRWIEGRGAAVTDSEGVVQTIAGVAGDITVRRLAEMRAENERARLQLALDGGGMGLWEWDLDADLVHWTDHLDEMYGAVEGITFDEWAGRLHSGDRPGVVTTLQAISEHGGEATLEHRVLDGDGTVTWIETRVRRVTGPSDQRWVVGVATDVTERKDAEGRLRRKSQLLQTLNDVGRAITARLDLGQVVQMVTEAGTDLTGASMGAFFSRTVEPDGDVHYSLSGLAGLVPGQVAGMPGPRSTPLLAPALSGRATVRVDDLHTHRDAGRNKPYQGPPPGHPPVRSFLAVPVVSGTGAIHGALFFGDPEPGRFSDHDEVVATGIAAQASVAIENARLFAASQRELEGRRHALEERDTMVRELQRSLLPPTLPEADGVTFAARFRPGEGPVGGDFYDVFPLGHDEWGVTIGDVCGKGHAAAWLTALARHTLRSAAVVERRPRAVLQFLNNAIRRADTDLFCATGYARLRVVGERVLGLVGLAGHPAGHVVRSAGTVESAPNETGMVLGVVEHPPVGEGTVRLAPGDAFVLCTDGVLEARGDRGRFGVERLQQVLTSVAGSPAAAIADAIIGALDNFETGSRRDDVAILVIGAPH